MELVFIGFFIFLFGLAVGSFLGAVSWRVPRGISIVRPPSACPHCEQRLGLPDLLPILSHLLAKGRCRHCREPVSRRYSLIELATGVGFVAAFLFTWRKPVSSDAFVAGGSMGDIADWPQFFTLVFLYSLMVVMTVIDLEHMLLPDRINVVGAAGGLVFALVGYGVVTPLQALYGALLGFAIVFLIVVLSRGGMGMGDAKFLAMIGVFVGPLGVLYTLFGASALGAVVGGLYIWLGKHGRGTPIPFGPFLATAALGVWVYMAL